MNQDLLTRSVFFVAWAVEHFEYVTHQLCMTVWIFAFGDLISQFLSTFFVLVAKRTCGRHVSSSTNCRFTQEVQCPQKAQGKCFSDWHLIFCGNVILFSWYLVLFCFWSLLPNNCFLSLIAKLMTFMYSCLEILWKRHFIMGNQSGLKLVTSVTGDWRIVYFQH